MSYDLTARSDDAYSETISRQTIYRKIRNETINLKYNGKKNFVSEAEGGFYLEIDVELVSEEGDNIENDNPKLSKKANCINFHLVGEITEKNVKRAMYFACKISNSLGWRAIDNQIEENISFQDQLKPWWKFW